MFMGGDWLPFSDDLFSPFGGKQRGLPLIQRALLEKKGQSFHIVRLKK
jgi:hypothetical protein